MIPVYEAVFKEGETEGVYGISLVENPAMEDEFIALSEQKRIVEFSAIDEKKRLLLGAVLIPNKKIYRNIDGNEFYITFTDETIGKLAHNFIKGGNQNNSSAEHEVQLSDVSFVESWQVEDEKIDKSALYGKKYSKGTWVAMAKVSDEIYKQATNGTFKGFSIDALLGLEKLTLNKQQMTEEVKKNVLEEIRDTFKSLLNTDATDQVADVEVKEAVELAEEVKQDETVELMEDGKEEEVKEDAAFDVDALKAEILEELRKELGLYEEEMSKQLAAKDEAITELKAQLNKQPETESVSVTPETKQTTNNNYEYGKNRPASIAERVFANFNN